MKGSGVILGRRMTLLFLRRPDVDGGGWWMTDDGRRHSSQCKPAQSPFGVVNIDRLTLYRLDLNQGKYEM